MVVFSPAVLAAGKSIGKDLLSNAGNIMSSLFGKKDNAAAMAALQYQYQRLLNQQSYDLTQQGYRETPLNQRIGYESAGINPILAMSNGATFGSYSGGSAGMAHGSSNAEMGSMLTNAYKTFALERSKNKAEILGINAGIKNTNADTALKAEQVMTERARQTQIDVENAKTRLETELAQKDLDYYDRRAKTSLLELLNRAEYYRTNASLAEYNAETARMSAEANAYESQYREEHPIYNWADRWSSVIGRAFGGAGAGVNAYNATKPSITENVKFDSNSVYKGHTRTTVRRGR